MQFSNAFARITRSDSSRRTSRPAAAPADAQTKRQVQLLRSSGLFEASFLGPDFADAMKRHRGMRPERVYLENREFWRAETSPFFSGRHYLDRHKGIVPKRKNPLVHYIHRGFRVGLDAHPLIDIDYIVLQLLPAGSIDRVPNFVEAKQRILAEYGDVRELLRATGVNPNTYFDNGYYRGINHLADRDVIPVEDYLRRRGRTEDGRYLECSSDVDLNAYMNRYPDLVKAGVVPLQHLLQSGLSENRQALTKRPDVDKRFQRNTAALYVDRGEPASPHQFHSWTRRTGQLASPRHVGRHLSESLPSLAHEAPADRRRATVGVVLYRNSDEQLSRLIQSIRREQQEYPQYQIDVAFLANDVENLDRYTALLGDTTVRVAPSRSNVGFGRGHNLLMKEAFERHELYIGANPDGYFVPGSIKALIDFSDYYGGQALVEASAMPLDHPKWHDPILLDTPWVSGACFALGRPMWESVGGFDEEIHLYCEDVDLSWRVRLAGGLLKVCPTARFMHDVTPRFHEEETAETRRRELNMLAGSYFLAVKWHDDEGAEKLENQIRAKARDEVELYLRRPSAPMPKRDTWVTDFVHQRLAPSRFWVSGNDRRTGAQPKKRLRAASRMLTVRSPIEPPAVTQPEALSASEATSPVEQPVKRRTLLFGDTYVAKHLDCATSIIDELEQQGIASYLTDSKVLPGAVDCDALVYFNLPVNPPPPEYDGIPRILIDHGASNLKWFLANARRFDFFDAIITAGPGHVDSLLAFFRESETGDAKVTAGGFIKAHDLLSPPRNSRASIARQFGLDPERPIVLFAPTWHLSRHPDMVVAGEQLAALPNHVASLHPETVNLAIPGLNTVESAPGRTTELLKHADVVVSDLSSTLFEAAALHKPTVQVLMREYSDNNALMFDFPFVAGTAELFLGGLMARPHQVADVVEQALSEDRGVRDQLNFLHSRILRDTHIDEEVPRRIVEQLDEACARGRLSVEEDGRRAEVRADNLTRVHQNMFFAQNRLIAHGAGDYGKHHASNSLEAARAAMGAIGVVEFDFVKGLDGVLVAHDTFEERFGFDKPFGELSREIFAGGRYGGELTPLSVEDALGFATPGKAVVCDVKAPKADYPGAIEEIHRVAEKLGVLDRVVMQCYSVDDFELARRQGFTRTLLAVWKYFYREPQGSDSFNFLARCMEIDDDAVIGISAPYINKHLDRPIFEYPEFGRFYSFWKRLYIHGAPVGEYPSILQRNLGLFADRFSADLEFQHLEPGFNWVQYLFLNPELIDRGIDNQVAAVVHYLESGRAEGRPHAYDCPEDFVYSRYLDRNRGLRQEGIGGNHTARAHWTRVGKREGRPY